MKIGRVLVEYLRGLSPTKKERNMGSSTTRFDYRCERCVVVVQDVQGHIGNPPIVACPTCGKDMVRYFGIPYRNLMNFGEQPHHDDIEQFRFRNLG